MIKTNCSEMAPLSHARLAACTQPFTFTGINFLGPIEVPVGRSIEKHWLFLSTCLKVRCIHLEVLHCLDDDTFILTFRRFTQRRGELRKVFSDNFTNYVGGER